MHKNMDLLFILDQIQLLRIKTVVNRALPSLHGGSHKITRTVLNSLIKKQKCKQYISLDTADFLGKLFTLLQYQIYNNS